MQPKKVLTGTLVYFCAIMEEENEINPAKFPPLRCCFSRYRLTTKNYIMYLTSEKKAELFAKYGNDAKNTGSAESQIALFTFRINHLTEHLKENRKDFGTERALTALVGKRRRMLDYLKAKDIERYRAIIKELGIRK